MSANILRFSRSPHERALEALPWFISDSLDRQEHDFVELHLAQCAHCRKELAFQRELRAHYVGSVPAADCKPALDRLLSRLESEVPFPTRPAFAGLTGRIGFAWHALPRWTVAALTAQIFAIGVLGYSLERTQAPPGTFHTLSSGSGTPVARGNVVLLVDPATPERELRRILRVAGARIVDGPLVNGGYVLDVPQDELSGALALLRREPAVRRVQALGGAPPR